MGQFDRGIPKLRIIFLIVFKRSKKGMCKAKQYACLHNNFCPTKFLTSGCAQTRKLYLFTPIFKLFSSSISGNSCGEKKYSESRSYTKQYYVTTVKTGQN